MAWTQRRLKAALRKHEPWLIEQPGVNSIGIVLGRSGGCCLEISTSALTSAARRKIEEALGEVPVQFVEAGPFQALKR